MFASDHFEQLIHRHLDQIATAEELAELDRLVVERPEVAEALLEAGRVDALLTLHLRGTEAVGSGAVASVAVRSAKERHFRGAKGDSARPAPWRRLVLAVIAIAAALLLGLGVWQWFPVPAGHPVVAGTIEVDGSPAKRVADDAPLRVVGDGPAVIQLAGGARAELQAATAAVIRRPDGSQAQTIELLEGGGRFQVPRRTDRRFCVQTCNGSVTALGTDFEVNLWSTQGKGDQEMSFRSMFVLAVAVAAGMVQVDVPGEKHVLSAGSQRVFGAEVPKVKSLTAWLPSGDVLGFTGKGGQPFALEQTVPGIQGALALTDEQKTKISAAADQTIHSEKVRAAMATVKLDPNATEAQKEEAKRVLAEARAKLRDLTTQVLTPEQKSLLPRISEAVAEARKQAAAAMETELIAGKGDPAKAAELQKQLRQKTSEAVQAGLEKLLTPAQLAAYKKAAEAQVAAEKLGKDKKPKGDDQPKKGDGKKPKGDDQPKKGDVKKPKGEDQPKKGDVKKPRGEDLPKKGDDKKPVTL
jgi:hypothetical protein